MPHEKARRNTNGFEQTSFASALCLHPTYELIRFPCARCDKFVGMTKRVLSNHSTFRFFAAERGKRCVACTALQPPNGPVSVSRGVLPKRLCWRNTPGISVIYWVSHSLGQIYCSLKCQATVPNHYIWH